MAEIPMTGRDLIVYISTHHLEDNKLYNGYLTVHGNGFMKDEDVASVLCVGIATVRVWYKNDYFEGAFSADGVIYVPKDEIIRILSEKLKEAGVRI